MMILIYVTYKDKEGARKIVRNLLDEKLIVCGTILRVESLYLWNSRIEEDDEFVSILKTKEEKWERVKERIKELHSYEVPCILKLKVDANKKYLDWMEEEFGREKF